MRLLLLILTYGHLGIALAAALVALPAFAQNAVISDATLGSEASVVTPDVINGINGDRISGGALRGPNLFHSFEQFDVGLGFGAYFENPAGVQSIFSRVTGENASNLLGVLGVLGSADLYFINPNGIVFGESARLDVTGAFTATTAEAIEFGAAGRFSATAPEVPGALLTVNPSAYWFASDSAASILNRSVATSQTLQLLSPTVVLDGAVIRQSGGSLLISGPDASGRLEVGAAGQPQLPIESAATVSLTNAVIETDRTSIDIQAGTLALENSQISTAALGAEAAGDIRIEAETVRLNNSFIISFNSAASTGAVGSLFVKADTVDLQSRSQVATVNGNASLADGATPLPTVAIAAETIRLSGGSLVGSLTLGAGKSSSVMIDAADLSLQDGSFINNNTSGPGDGSDTTVRVRSTFTLEDRSSLFSATSDVGNAGDVVIETAQLKVLSGSTISGFTSGADATGNGGDLTIRASESIEVAGTFAVKDGVAFASINSNAGLGSAGNGGNIVIETERLSLRDGGEISVSAIGSSGNAGTILVQAADIEMTGWAPGDIGFGTSGISATVSGTRPEVNGGTVTVNAQRLVLQDGAAIEASLRGQGSASSIVINAAESVVVDGSTGPINNAGQQIPAGIFANVQTKGEGQGGSIEVNTPSLSLNNGGQIGASTFNLGNAGSITINADKTLLSGTATDGGVSGIFADVGTTAIGSGGDLAIAADQLVLQDGAVISAATGGQGDAGNLRIEAEQVELIDDSRVSSGVGSNAVGNGGNLEIYANQLRLVRGSIASVNTSGQGSAGTLMVVADNIEILGSSATRFGGFFSGVDSDAQGRGGDQIIRANRLLLQDGGRLSALTFGEGAAGNLFITADTLRLSGIDSDGFSSLIVASVGEGGSGQGGTVEIQTNQLQLLDGGGIEVATQGSGNGGLLIVRADTIDLIGTDGQGFSSGLATGVAPTADGNGGDLQIETIDLTVRQGAIISATTQGRGAAGDVTISAKNQVLLEGTNAETGASSGVFARSLETAQGQSGDVVVQARDLNVVDGAVINTQTFNAFSGGDIVVRADRVEALGGGQIITSTSGSGSAGDISLVADQSVRVAGSDPTYSNRLQQVSRRQDLSNEGPASGLFANTREGSTGSGGRIEVSTPTLRLEGGAQISSQSLGLGTAGAIALNASRLQLTDSSILTAAPQAAGGDISVNLAEGFERGLVILQNGNVTTASLGDGGNIVLNGAAVIALGDSNIIARSQGARGGNITLENFFSQTQPPDNQLPFEGDGQVDLNADGELAAGSITITDTGFIQNSLSTLPAELINTSQLLSGSCIARAGEGRFVVTGNEGLAESPGQAPSSRFPTDVVRPPTEVIAARPYPVEPQAAYRLPDGRLVLSRECGSETVLQKD